MGVPQRFPLATLPTPLTRASRLERALQAGPIWLKRDDLTGFATAGNKARPLEFLLGDAIAGRADVLVATGSPSSNFCAAAAVAARVAGLACEVLYAGAEPAPAPAPVGLARAAGARLCFEPGLAREDLDDAVQCHAQRLRAAGRRPYPLPRGGATPVGCVGFALAARELAEQCEQVGLRPAAVVLATGSGGTQAGLVAGAVGYRLGLRIVGASVSRPVDEIRPRVLALAQGCVRLLGPAEPGEPAESSESAEPGEADIDIRDAIEPGFGTPSESDRCSATLALDYEGLLLDGTYTAKAMTLLREVVHASDDPVVFWHTSGGMGKAALLGGER